MADSQSVTTAAKLPADEQERLTLLRAMELLDTEPEPVFDRITRLLARSLSTPIALFTLIDEHRQWFKSRVGVDVPEMHRDVAFCAHAINESGPLIVPDAEQDPRFANNPLVLNDPRVRFYAGVPIRTSAGLALGTLCAADSRPRTLTSDELAVLQDLASMVTREIHLRETLLLTRSELDRADAMVTASEARFRAIFEHASVGIGLFGKDGVWLSVNDALCELVGYSRDELRQMSVHQLTHPDDVRPDLQADLEAADVTPYKIEKRYLHKNGTPIWVTKSVSRKNAANGELEYYIAVVTDIQANKEAQAALSTLHQELEMRVQARTRQLSEANRALQDVIERQQRTEQALRDREAELASIIENANDAYISLDEQGLVRAWNRVAEETFGWSAREAIGKALDQLIIPAEMGGAHRSGMARFLATGQAKVLDQRLELPAVRKDGTSLVVEVRIRALKIGERTQFSAFLHDISDRKAAEALREQEARHDALTGLPNRRALSELLPLALARADRNQSPLGVVFIDLDGFKTVNDSFGHEAGDELLRVIATRLCEGSRACDMVSRLAGDEFTVVLEGLHNGLADARTVASKLLARIAEPVELAWGTANVHASMGIAVYTPGSATNATELIREADSWMYKAKRAGKGTIFPTMPGE
ncbi:sensor domain-containing diguanylate cyclase [Pseudomonas sp. Marseille-QA0892]